MDKIYIEGHSLVHTAQQHGVIGCLIVSRRLYRLMMLKSLQGKWIHDMQLLPRAIESDSFIFPLFCFETGCLIGYKAIEDNE